jgi:hypothetical protein
VYVCVPEQGILLNREAVMLQERDAAVLLGQQMGHLADQVLD